MNELLAPVDAALEALVIRAERAECAACGVPSPPADDIIDAHVASGGAYLVTANRAHHLVSDAEVAKAIARRERDNPPTMRWLALSADGMVSV